MKLPRIMLAAPASGSGKTLLTCGLLQALVQRNIKTASFKCGPDYIDPLFHTKVIGTPSRNLDTFFTDAETTRYLFGRVAKDAELSVMEGVMGYFDGVAGVTTQASSYDLARVTQTPVVLVVNAKGMSLSVVSMIHGFLSFRPDTEAEGKAEGEAEGSAPDVVKGKAPDAAEGEASDIAKGKVSDTAEEKVLDAGNYIRGVILNNTTAGMYPMLKKKIEESLPVQVLGYVPKVEDCVIESRHLGLVTPNEITDLKEKLTKLAGILEETIEIDALLRLAQAAPELDVTEPVELQRFFERNITKPAGLQDFVEKNTAESIRVSTEREEKFDNSCETIVKNAFDHTPRIAVARDEAFCFYYEDNLELLKRLGAELVLFSPLHDAMIPENADGLLFGGGYPELYAKELSANVSMRASIRDAVSQGMPYLAECGGFMYLHETMEDMVHRSYPMVGALAGHVRKTDRLGRFGYITLTAEKAQVFGEKGTQIRAHEFHYFDSSDNGEAFLANKPKSKRSWQCMQAGDFYAAGFPHLYYYSNPEFAASFLRSCLPCEKSVKTGC